MPSVILATAGYDQTIRFWEASTGVCYRTLNTMLIAMGFLLALPLSQLIARGCRMHASKRRILADSATTIWLVLAMLAHAPLTNLILGCLQCEWFDDISVLQRDRALHFGLSDACTAEVKIIWPDASMSTQSFTLDANHTYLIRKGEAPVVTDD